MNENIPKEYLKATKSAINILNYADKSEKKLRERLCAKGYNREQRDFACEYVKKIGLLNDDRLMNYKAERIANVKLYGKRRIRQELYAGGFEKDKIDEIDYSEIDFAENCKKRILNTKGRYDTREKLENALLRYGFSWNDIHSAYQLLKEEENEQN